MVFCLTSVNGSPPNIILILVDDQGYYDLGCYGASEVETPRIDGMAASGVRLTDYYAAAPICSPSRAGLLTGCYPRRVGNHIWVHRADSVHGIHPDELTLAELLQTKGYATGCIGKWHLGFDDAFLPNAQGFDHYFGLHHNLDPVERVYFGEDGPPLMQNGRVVQSRVDPSELCERYTDEALRFIDRHQQDPFFLYLPHTMLHNPLGVGPAFQGTSQWGEYGDAIEELDFHVGRILDKLTETGLQDNTLVIYVSDNGRGPGRNSDQPLQGRKLSTYEAGMRVPAIVWGPGLSIEEGKTSAELTHAMDWYPTLATIAGIRVPKNRIIDGRDLTPMLTGQSKRVPAPGLKLSLNADVPLRRPWDPPGEWSPLIKRYEYNDAFFYHGAEGALAAVRWRNWKLTLSPSLRLFDLSKDPREQTPIRNGQITRKLRGMVVLFQHEMERHARRAGDGRSQFDRDAKTSVGRNIEAQLSTRRNITYTRAGDHELQMDIYRPKDPWGDLPGIVCIHGGGWANGNRSNHGNLAKALAARGFVAATISYRLSGEAPFPAAIEDCKAAVRFLRSQANQLGIDRDHIGAIGLSAGGHLTALLGTSGGVKALEGSGGHMEFSSTIQAAVPMGAQTDLLSERTREISAVEERGRIWRQFLSGSQEAAHANYRSASPLTHLDAEDPPMLFITGGRDDPSTRAKGFRARMNELTIDQELLVIDDAPHPFLGKQVWFDEAVEAAANFFHAKLKAGDSN